MAIKRMYSTKLVGIRFQVRWELRMILFVVLYRCQFGDNVWLFSVTAVAIVVVGSNILDRILLG